MHTYVYTQTYIQHTPTHNTYHPHQLLVHGLGSEFIYSCIYTYTYKYIHLCIYIYMYIYKHIHTYQQQHMHTHTHTQQMSYTHQLRVDGLGSKFIHKNIYTHICTYIHSCISIYSRQQHIHTQTTNTRRTDFL